MNRILKSVIAAGLFISMAISSSAQRPVQVVSPIVHSDNTVTFNFLAPEAENVKISAQFAPKTDMVKGENGVWSITLGPATFLHSSDSTIFIFEGFFISSFVIPFYNNS